MRLHGRMRDLKVVTPIENIDTSGSAPPLCPLVETEAVILRLIEDVGGGRQALVQGLVLSGVHEEISDGRKGSVVMA